MKRSTLVGALFLMATAGFILHYRAHPFLTPDTVIQGVHVFNLTNFFASLFSAVDLVLVTILFLSRKTAVYGYLLNGLIVIYGTIFMAHYSVVDIMVKSLPPSSWIIKTTLPHICISWADFLVGKSLYDLYRRERIP